MVDIIREQQSIHNSLIEVFSIGLNGTLTKWFSNFLFAHAQKHFFPDILVCIMSGYGMNKFFLVNITKPTHTLPTIMYNDDVKNTTTTTTKKLFPQSLKSNGIIVKAFNVVMAYLSRLFVNYKSGSIKFFIFLTDRSAGRIVKCLPNMVNSKLFKTILKIESIFGIARKIFLF